MVGQFLRQPHGRGLTDNYYLKTIDAAPRYICLFPGEHPRLASLLEVSLQRFSKKLDCYSFIVNKYFCMVRFNWFYYNDNCHIAKFKCTVYKLMLYFFYLCIIQDEWKGDPNVKSVITMYFTERTQSYELALYFNVKEGDKNFNYYLEPQDDCRDIQCQLSVKRKDVTGLDPVEMEIMNINFLRFSTEYHNPGGNDLSNTK